MVQVRNPFAIREGEWRVGVGAESEWKKYERSKTSQFQRINREKKSTYSVQIQTFPSKHINTISHTFTGVTCFQRRGNTTSRIGRVKWILGSFKLDSQWLIQVFLYVLSMRVLQPALLAATGPTVWTSLPLLPLTLRPIGFLSAIWRPTLSRCYLPPQPNWISSVGSAVIHWPHCVTANR